MELNGRAWQASFVGDRRRIGGAKSQAIFREKQEENLSGP
jgi:hypothetical protein